MLIVQRVTKTRHWQPRRRRGTSPEQFRFQDIRRRKLQLRGPSASESLWDDTASICANTVRLRLERAQLRRAAAVVLRSTPIIVVQKQNVETTPPARHWHRRGVSRRVAA